jgi:hypothetical protein
MKWVVEYLYDMGYRTEDYIFITFGTIYAVLNSLKAGLPETATEYMY